MFEFGVYVGPAIVIFGMLLAFIGFAVWGSGAIRESADEAQAALDVADSAKEQKSDTEITSISLPELSVISADMEKTAEFSQPLDIVPTFSQSFLEGQELAPGVQSADYNAAIDRIKADLEASDNEEINTADVEDDEDTFFDYGADDFAFVGMYGEDGYSTENSTGVIDSDIIEAANVVEALQANHENDKADAKVLADAEAAKTDVSFESNDNIAEKPYIEDSLNTDEKLSAEEVTDNKVEESTPDGRPQLGDIEQEAMEETMILRYPKQDAVKGQAAELLDAVALEETRMHDDIPISAGLVDSEAKDITTVSSVDLAGLEDMSEEGILVPETPIAFGSRMAWLAIPGFKPSEVIALLRLGDVKSANWTMGLTQAYADNNQVFVSPSLGGWVLVIGKTLWQKADMNRSAENIPWLKDIGRRFGNVCFFSTMKGLGNHGWIGIRDGQIARAYGYSGELQELIWFVGEPTEEEEIINPAFVDETQEKYQPGFRPVIPDEKLVLAMAAAWSVDTSFKRRQYPPDFGFLGTMN